MKAFQVLSPDYLTISFEHWAYKSKKEAKKALSEWMKRYESQGYYSSNRGRIALKDLKYFCEIREIEVDSLEEED